MSPVKVNKYFKQKLEKKCKKGLENNIFLFPQYYACK